jgi:hypothetical protein
MGTNYTEKVLLEKSMLEDKIKRLEETLSLMPEDTFLGRVCVMGYLKKYKKDLSRLKENYGLT